MPNNKISHFNKIKENVFLAYVPVFQNDNNFNLPLIGTYVVYNTNNKQAFGIQCYQYYKYNSFIENDNTYFYKLIKIKSPSINFIKKEIFYDDLRYSLDFKIFNLNDAIKKSIYILNKK